MKHRHKHLSLLCNCSALVFAALLNNAANATNGGTAQCTTATNGALLTIWGSADGLWTGDSMELFTSVPVRSTDIVTAYVQRDGVTIHVIPQDVDRIDGWWEIVLAGTHRYDVVVYDGGGNQQARCGIDITGANRPPNPTCALTSDSAVIYYPQKVVLNSYTANANTYEIRDEAGTLITSGVGGNNSGSFDDPGPYTQNGIVKTFTLTVTPMAGATGGNAVCQTSVTSYVRPPSCTLTGKIVGQWVTNMYRSDNPTITVDHGVGTMPDVVGQKAFTDPSPGSITKKYTATVVGPGGSATCAYGPN